MKTDFITVEIDLQESHQEMLDSINAVLKNFGEPLRWAISDVDTKSRKAYLEAVVTIKN